MLNSSTTGMIWRLLSSFLALGFVQADWDLRGEDFRITDIRVEAPNTLSIQHESVLGNYFILYWGSNIADIHIPLRTALNSPTPRLSVSLPSPKAAFFRLRSVPQTEPLDSDGDGVDDVFELLHPPLDPLNADDTLTRIKETSPANGESDVAVNRETFFRLTRPLSTNALITTSQLNAQFGGRRILSRVEISSDRRTVTLFYLEPLPGGARIRVTFDGSGLTDSSGKGVDLDQDNRPGGTATVDFDTISLVPVTNTFICGRVFASALKPVAGGPNQFVNEPLGGVTITVDGREENMRTVTDDKGDFRLGPVPVGAVFVHIDGRTVTNLVAGIHYPDLAYYPNVNKKWESRANCETNLGEIYLPLIPAQTLQPLNTNVPTTLTFTPEFIAANPLFSGVSITIPTGALFSENGTRGGFAGIAPVNGQRLPGPLPDGVYIQDVVTIQTDGGGNFDQPVPACFPNIPDVNTGQRLLPGAKSALISFNHDTGRFEVVGTMTVSADGNLVCTDPGVGILAPGWHGQTPASDVRGGNAREDDGQGNGGGDGNPPGAEGDQTGGDGDGGQPDGQPNTPCNVTFHNGEEYFDVVDLSIPGRGEINFSLSRRYRSRVGYNGPLGHNWDFNYNSRLYPQPTGDIQRVDGFGHVDVWVRNADGTFKAPQGYFGTLIRRPDGFYILREPDGFKKFYRADGRLVRYEDRNRNAMLFEYGEQNCLARVIDCYGREIDFIFQTYLEAGQPVQRLARIRDFVGREVVYSYDERGDLVSVRSPAVTGTSTGNDFPNGRTERYTYSSGFADERLNHNILTRTLPEEVATGGPPAFRWTYGTNANDISFDRVIARTRGGTNASGIGAGGTMTLTYQSVNEGQPPGNADLPRLKVTHTDLGGNVTEHFFNESNFDIITRRLTRGFRSGEPAAYETKSYYDADGQLVRRIFPEGNEIRIRYGAGSRAADRDLIETRRIAGPRGGGEDMVTTFTYEPLYNQLASTTDPRGNATNFVPPIGQASAARYTTHFFFDYQESNGPIPDVAEFKLDITGIQRGLGDLNGDGRTNQLAGNVVRTASPAVQLLPGSYEAARLGSNTQQVITETQWNDRGQVTSKIDPEGNVTDYFYYPENDPDGDNTPTVSRYMFVANQPRGYLEHAILDARASPRRTTKAALAALETRYRYDVVGNVIGVLNPRGIETQSEVNALNEVVVTTRGADVSMAVARKELPSGTAALAYRTRSYYDYNGRVVKTEVENRDSNTPGLGEWIRRTFTYDILGQILETSAEVEAATTIVSKFRYTPNELLTLVVQPEGNQVLTRYDERDLPFEITRGFGSPEASVNRIDYDLNGNQVRFIDAEDNDGDGKPEATLFAYDGFDRLVTVTNALGGRSLTTYDIASQVIQSRFFGHPAAAPAAPNALLKDIRFHYDELKRLFQTDASLFLNPGIDPVRPVNLQDNDGDHLVTSRLEYDALSRPTYAIDDDLQATQTIYDGVNRHVATIDALSNRVETVYDPNSHPSLLRSIEVSPEGLVPNETFTTIYVRDQLDRLVRVTDNAGQTTRFIYDSRNNLVGQSDPEGPLTADPLGLYPGQINGPGNTVHYSHDGLNRMIRRIADLRVGGTGAGAIDTSNPYNPDGQITLGYVFDRNSRLVGIVDDNGNRTSFGYDALNRKTGHTNADNTAYAITYDHDDNIRTVIDPNGSRLTTIYDALNRIVEGNVTRGANVLGTTHEAFAYDGLSRLARCTDDNGNAATSLQTVEYVYDSLGRTLEERQNGRAISSQYRGNGKRTQITYPGGRTITRTFDKIDRIKQLMDGAQVIAQSDWIGPGLRELRRISGNGTQLTFLNDAGNLDVGYDAVQRLVGLRVVSPTGAPLVDREYAYNRASQRTAERRHDDAGLTDRYTYDSTYRVTASAYDQDGSAGATPRDLSSMGYDYDGAGNRRNVTGRSRASGQFAQDLTVNNVNEYTTIDALPRFHDHCGSLTDDGSTLFAYDYKNRLVALRSKSTGNPIADYQYLSDGRRAKKTVYSQTQPGVVEKATAFLSDGAQEIEEQEPTSGQTEATYVWSPVSVDELVQFKNSRGTFHARQDARGDVIAITDVAGQVVERVRYDDFGQAEIRGPAGEARTNSAVGNSYMFQGRKIDSETGLYFFRARYYDPRTGRFIQRDSVWDARNVGSQYTFVGNRPVTSGDPSGLRVRTVDPRTLDPATQVEVLQSTAGAEVSVAGGEIGLGTTIGTIELVNPSLGPLGLGVTGAMGVAATVNAAAAVGLSLWGLGHSIIARDSAAENLANVEAEAIAWGQLRQLQISRGLSGAARVFTQFFQRQTGRAPSAADIQSFSEALAQGQSELDAATTAIRGTKMKPCQQEEQEEDYEAPIHLYHGTSSNRGSKIVGNMFYERQGFVPRKYNEVFFGEEPHTAEWFATETGTDARAFTVIEFTVPRGLARDLGLLERHKIGERNELPFPDIPSGSGFERILTGSSRIEAFNAAFKAGQIGARRLRIR